MHSPQIDRFFHEPTSTFTWLVSDPASRTAVVIDPVRGFDAASGRTGWASAEAVAAVVRGRGLELPFVLDTNAHADHLSGLPYFREHFGARTVIGAHISEVQRIFRELFHLEEQPVDGRPFDVLLEDGQVLEAGGLRIDALHTPGHTPACLTYRIGEALFVGDTLFMPDYGTARCDFPGGSAETLYDSIQRLYGLGDALRVHTCHDYRPGGRPLRSESTIGEERRTNVQLRHDTKKEDYVAFRRERDAGLSMPALLLPSVQVNIRAGELPPPEANGVAYLKIPLDATGSPAAAGAAAR